ncbi:MAG: flagellar export chaperone FliS [Planctomycetota bacterium]
MSSQARRHAVVPAAKNGVNQYLRAQVMTASPERIQLMLFDGALRFGEQARHGLRNHDYDLSHDKLKRVQRIVQELIHGLRPEHDPVTCKQLEALYNFAYLKLVEANIHHSEEALDEALNVLRYQRETWAMLLERLEADEAKQVKQDPRVSMCA